MFPVRILHLNDVVDLQIVTLGGADVFVAKLINTMRGKSFSPKKMFRYFKDTTSSLFKDS